MIEIVLPELPTIPAPEPVKPLDTQALIESAGGNMEKASDAAFKVAPKINSEFEKMLAAYFEAYAQQIAAE